MYVLKSGIKNDPVKRWALPDRVFFGFGACHILAGVYLSRRPLAGFYAEWIIPAEGFSGNHIYVTDGLISFDFHGYSARENLLSHHINGWSRLYDGWNYQIEKVDFDLLDTDALNQRKMRGPDQYLYNTISRARQFIDGICHDDGFEKAFKTLPLIARK